MAKEGGTMSCGLRRLLVLALAMGLSGCFGKAEPPPIVLGHVATLSGPDRGPGEHALRGIRLAVDEVARDADKGPGRPILVRHTDTRGELEAFESEAVRLVAINNARVLLGGTMAGEVERLQRGGVPVVSPTGMHTRTMGDVVFLTGLAPVTEGQILAQFAGQERAARTAAVLVDARREDQVLLADAFARAFAAAVQKRDPKATPKVEVSRYGSRPEVLTARVGKPDVLLFGGSFADLRDLLAALKRSELPVLWSGDGLPTSGEGWPTNPIYHLTLFSAQNDRPVWKSFVEQYRKAFSEEPDEHAALAFENARLVIEALRQADRDYRPAHLKDKLAELREVPGLAGPLSFSPEHQLRRPLFLLGREGGHEKLIKRVEAP
jgi:branched-chain amino acid transport system substrate-binding protein